MRTILFIVSFFTAIHIANTQTPVSDPRINAIHTIIDAYNRQDFKAMKKPWFWFGKLIIPKKKLRDEFVPFYKTNGKLSIDTITYSSRYQYVAKLRLEKKPADNFYFQFLFSEKGKVEGMGNAYPPLIYKKRKASYQTDLVDSNTAIDSLIAKNYTNNKLKPFNGSVLVLDKGKPIYKKHFGGADFSTNNPLNDSTLFELASCSKQFTAIAILILEQQGKLKLTDSIQQFIPDFPYHQITIGNLLTHTSGLPDYEELLRKVWDRTKFATNYDVIEAFKKHRPKILFKPNEKFIYSNAGYMLLSVIIEKASGVSYNNFLKETIFTPLGMKHSRIFNTRRAKKETIPNYAYGYVFDKDLQKYILPDSSKQHQDVVYQDAITGDGTVNSCINDLILWENELLKPTLLAKKNFERVFNNHQTNTGELINY
ncbi:MAG: serine hydrolase domain-containing protein [Saprospiraceae bacterium]